MKHIYTFLLVILTVVFASCQKDGDVDNVGYLNFNVDTYVSVKPGSRTIVEGYNPKRLAVQIVDASGAVVQETNDYDKWQLKNTNIPLKPGTYTVKAHSYGFDGKDSGFDIPYYVGSSEVKIETGVLKTTEVICTLANVKVSVVFDQSFVESFTSAKVEVSSAVSGVQPMTFVMGTTKGSAYFPAGRLDALVSVVNKFNKNYSQSNVIAENVQPRSHYILKYKIAPSGSANNIVVETDDSNRTYTYTFMVSSEPTTRLTVSNLATWSNFAVFNGEALLGNQGEVIDINKLTFEYKKESDKKWMSVPASQKLDKFEGKATLLEPGTSYVCRMTYAKTDSVFSNVISFTTDLQPELPYGNMDTWSTVPTQTTVYPGVSEFWDTSNPGTTQGTGKFVNVNTTTGVSSPVHTPSGKSAKLQSCKVSPLGITKFAAASLYTGDFLGLVGTKGANIQFGRPFSARPTQLTGWFQYSSGLVEFDEENLPAGTISKGEPDLWAGYVVLTTEPVTIDSSKLPGSAVDYAAKLQDDNDNLVVAYGALPDSECVPSSQWKQFTINLTYKDLVRKPTHAIIVFTSSKYGDYFTGSPQSLLYLDDLQLVYGDNPQVK